MSDYKITSHLSKAATALEGNGPGSDVGSTNRYLHSIAESNLAIAMMMADDRTPKVAPRLAFHPDSGGPS